MDDRTLELTLTRASASLAYPPTPRLRGRVLAAIAAAEPANAQRRPAFAFAMVAAAGALFAAVLALSFPASRSAIADFFGVEGSKVERLPTPPSGVTPTPFPPASDLPRDARPASLSEIAQALGFAPALPDGHGVPEEAFLVDYDGETVSILRYAEFDLWQTRPRSNISFGKGLPGSVILLEITVSDEPAYFIEGGAHIVAVFDEAGREIPGSERTVERNTLIFSTGRAFYRIETDLTRLDALRIAETLP
jgi:hypothetical protein